MCFADGSEENFNICSARFDVYDSVWQRLGVFGVIADMILLKVKLKVKDRMTDYKKRNKTQEDKWFPLGVTECPKTLYMESMRY